MKNQSTFNLLVLYLEKPTIVQSTKEPSIQGLASSELAEKELAGGGRWEVMRLRQGSATGDGGQAAVFTCTCRWRNAVLHFESSLRGLYVGTYISMNT